MTVSMGPGPSSGQGSPAWPDTGYGTVPTQGAGLDVATGLVLLGGAILGIAGSFPAVNESPDGSGASNATTVWTWSAGTSGTKIALSGLPLTIACVAGFVAGILLLTGLARRKSPVRTLAGVSAGLLVATALDFVLPTLDAKRIYKDPAYKFGPGFWLLIVTTVLGLIAVILAIAGSRSRAAAGGWAASPMPQQPVYGYQPAYPQQPAAQYQQQGFSQPPVSPAWSQPPQQQGPPEPPASES